MEEFLVVSALCTLENCAQVPNLVELLWELQPDQIISPYIVSALLQVRIPALIVLGLLSINADKGIVTLNEEISAVFSKKIVDAVKDISLSTEIGYIKVTAEELIKSANGFALDEMNAMHFLKNNIHLSLLAYFKGSNINDELSLIVMKFLWTLTTHPTVQRKLVEELEIVQEITSLADTMPAAKCALLKIKGWNFLQGKLLL